jgi:hypothetical protein
MTTAATEYDPLVNARALSDLDDALIALTEWEQANPKPESYKRVDSDEVKAAKRAVSEAWTEARQPFAAKVNEARKSLDLLHLPAGTRVSYYTDKGFAGGERHRGVITKITNQSYIVESASFRSGTARISRDPEAITNRRLIVLNGPRVEAMRREARERKAESWRTVQAADEAKRRAESAAHQLRRARHDALRHVGLLADFGRNPTEEACRNELIKMHQAEYDAMLSAALARAEAALPQDTPSEAAVEQAEAVVTESTSTYQALYDAHLSMPGDLFPDES